MSHKLNYTINSLANSERDINDLVCRMSQISDSVGGKKVSTEVSPRDDKEDAADQYFGDIGRLVYIHQSQAFGIDAFVKHLINFCYSVGYSRETSAEVETNDEIPNYDNQNLHSLLNYFARNNIDLHNIVTLLRELLEHLRGTPPKISSSGEEDAGSSCGNGVLWQFKSTAETMFHYLEAIGFYLIELEDILDVDTGEGIPDLDEGGALAVEPSVGHQPAHRYVAGENKLKATYADVGNAVEPPLPVHRHESVEHQSNEIK